MITIQRRSLALFMISSLLLGGSVRAEDEASRKKMIESPGGFLAEFVRLDGEGEGKTIIWKKRIKVAEIPSARPVSFSPKEDILLLAEYAADDDLRHFLLDLGSGEFKKEGNRLDYVFGGRYVKGATWSDDGKTLTLLYIEGLASKTKEEFSVEEILKR